MLGVIRNYSIYYYISCARFQYLSAVEKIFFKCITINCKLVHLNILVTVGDILVHYKLLSNFVQAVNVNKEFVYLWTEP